MKLQKFKTWKSQMANNCVSCMLFAARKVIIANFGISLIHFFRVHVHGVFACVCPFYDEYPVGHARWLTGDPKLDRYHSVILTSYKFPYKLGAGANYKGIGRRKRQTCRHHATVLLHQRPSKRVQIPGIPKNFWNFLWPG